MADADWDTVERLGSLDAVVEKIHQAGEKTVASVAARRGDDFRLWGQERAVVWITWLQRTDMHAGGARF